jgi:RHS repeat-associated protein
VTGDNGITETLRSYTPFGKPTQPDTSFDIIPDGYAGHVHDPEFGMVHMGARMYDATVGRFASTDPILAPYSSQGLNSYSYVWNNPATLIDPFGMQGNELSSPEGPIEDPFVVDTLNGYPGAAPDATITDTESGEVVSSSDTWSWAADPSTLAEGATPLPLPPSPAETHPTFSDNYGDWAPSEKTAEKMHQPDWFLSPRGQGGVGNARVWGDYDQVDTSDTMILTYTVLTLAVSVVEVGLGLAAARGAGVLLDDAVGFGARVADDVQPIAVGLSRSATHRPGLAPTAGDTSGRRQ